MPPGYLSLIPTLQSGDLRQCHDSAQLPRLHYSWLSPSRRKLRAGYAAPRGIVSKRSQEQKGLFFFASPVA